MMMRWFSLAGLLLALACIPGVPSTPAAPAANVDFQQFGSPFGLFGGAPRDGNLTADDLQGMYRELGVDQVRLSMFVWTNMEPQRGRYSFGNFRQYMKMLPPGGQNTGTFTPTSRWGVDNDKANRENRRRMEARGKRQIGDSIGKSRLYAGAPSDWDAWGEFVYRSVKEFKDTFRFWQIGNEPEGGHYGISPEDFVKLQKVGYEAAKRADPNCIIVLPGWTSGGTDIAMGGGQLGRELERFTRTVVQGARDHYDAIDIHLYGRYREIPGKIAWLRSMMLEVGIDKPIWTTELGGPDTRVDSYSEEKQREEVVKRHALVFANGISKAFLFRFFNAPSRAAPQFRNLGLLPRDSSKSSNKKKPAYYTYKQLIEKLDGFTAVETLDLGGKVDAYRFTRPDGPVHILWSDGSRTVELPVSAASVRITDLDGKVTTVSAEDGRAAIRLGRSPVYVEKGS